MPRVPSNYAASTAEAASPPFESTIEEGGGGGGLALPAAIFAQLGLAGAPELDLATASLPEA
eukprot:CAMPEP_0206122200 /NCGR_PEP_ID=MMETSP1472-20131121/1961_1 /ASSEMBLY_ACC=CAM_ASM_001108 /TAXON_ID=41880 /ORGANISM="Pycnococcus provasolii, Strain RCC251" /LENGTH=61 /DNA_ID=CAMNT_0053512661 /DNA_START=132 /DNA_END=317 /DNA_ORIENTATION=-